MVRVGVTGHRALAAQDALARAVDAVLDDVLAGVGGGEDPDRCPTLEVVSSLAEGADRLVVDRVLVHTGSRLVVVLPLDPDDYETDFADPASVGAFRAMLERAAEVEITGPDPGGSRESAYERAGQAVVERCDVLLGLWDGTSSRGRGGTADIIDHARERGRAVVIVPVTRAEPQP